MGFWAHIREALMNLLSSKIRSLLAVLGILVGTGSVVALISSSELATEHALSEFKKLGTNLIAVMLNTAGPPPANGQIQTFKPSDVQLIKQKIPEIEKIVPYTLSYEALGFKTLSFNGQILGAPQELAEIVKISLSAGRFVSFLDQNSFFCVVGNDIGTAISKLGIDPISQQIKVGSYLFTIIGVLKPWQPNLFMFADLNQGIIISLPLSLLINKHTEIQNILVQTYPDTALNDVKTKLENVIPIIAPGKQVRFRDPQQIIDVIAKQRSTFTLLLSAIGGISLLVGGIGVMNIMLVSVIERRREIGIRMALGARRKDILEMFLIESVMLTFLGGLIGVITGTIITFLIALISGWEYTFHIFPVLLGFLVSGGVGIFSGFYPSWRASRLDPIATLQSSN